MKKEVIARCTLILIDIFNLAEQFGIYFISKEAQQRFFFILFGVDCATLFYAIEISLHLIDLYTTKSDLDEITGKTCLAAYGGFPVRLLLYGLIYTGSILFIFLDSNSKFRDTYYECLTILSVFFGISYIDLVISSSCQSDSDDNTEEKIYRV